MGYFEDNRTPTGLVLDRQSTKTVCSIAAIGCDMDVQAIRATKGLITTTEALNRINTTLGFVVSKNRPENRGWLFHFIDPNGAAVSGSEISSIDTAIFYSGALQAAHRLADQTLIQRVSGLISKIDVIWMIENSPSHKRLCHGLRNGKFIPYEWDEYNEGVIAYHLFKIPFTPTVIRYDLPLFVYYYPLCFIHDDPALWEHLRNAIEWQRKHYGYVGVTATDTEYGYKVDPAYISPLALYCVGLPCDLPYTIHSYRIRDGWRSADRIGLDEGMAVLIKNRP
jgi:hypothetical protein